jgi:hypothetical protein
MNKGPTESTSLPAAIESGIPSPQKTLIKYIEDSFFWVLTLFALIIVWPFYWPVSVPALVLALFAGFACFRAGNARSRKRRRRRYRMAAVAALTIAVVWALIGPVLVTKRVIYVVLSQDSNPTSASFHPVGSPTGTQAQVLLVTDPIRKAAWPVMSKLLPNRVRITKVQNWDNGTFVRLPSLEKLTWKQDVAGLGKLEAIRLNALATSSEYRLKIRPEPDIRVASGPGLRGIVNSESLITKGSPPWHGCLLQRGPEAKALQYVVLLDLALRAMLDGASNETWELLQAAIKAEPPHPMEQVRVLTLEAKYARFVSDGNLGKLQSLLYAKPAMQLFVKHCEDTGTQNTPLAMWTVKSLSDLFEEFEADLNLDLRPMKALAEVPLNDKRSSLLDSRIEKWKKTSTKELADQIRKEEIKELAHLAEVQSLIVERMTTGLFQRVIRYLNDSSVPDGGWEEVSSQLNEALEILRLMKHLGSQAASAGFNIQMEKTFSWMADFFRAAATNADDASFEKIFVNCSDSRIGNLMRALFKNKHKIENGGLVALFSANPGNPSGRWWEPEFQNHFTTFFLRLVVGEKGEFPITNKVALIPQSQKISAKTVSRDGNGDGEPYLPGLLMICMMNERLQTDDAKELIRMFETLSGLDFRKFTSKL